MPQDNKKEIALIVKKRGEFNVQRKLFIPYVNKRNVTPASRKAAELAKLLKFDFEKTFSKWFFAKTLVLNMFNTTPFA